MIAVRWRARFGPAVWWMAWLAAVLPVIWRQVTTADAWWHVALGRWMWTHRAAPDFSQWYFTPVRQPVPDLRWTWLGDLTLAAAHALGGAVALQILPLLCVAAAVAVLRDLGRRAGAGDVWIWIVSVLLAVGTHQLQLPRNAVFSLPLLALVLWLCAATSAGSRRRWWLVPVAGLWSTVHGSYPLAVVVPAVWFAGEWLDEWREPRRWTRAARSIALVALCFGAVSLWNPSAPRLLTTPFHQIARPAPARIAGPTPDGRSPAPARSVATWLNGLLWSAGPGGIRSGDFASPFDRLEYRAVPAAFALGLLALARLLLARTWSWRWSALLAVSVAMGCAYLRMVGYLAFTAAACLCAGPPLRAALERSRRTATLVAAACLVIATAGAWWLVFTDRIGPALGRANHEFALGASPVFDDRAAAWIGENHRQARTFTTIVTGSHALLTWAGRQPVFIDGFFAPHPPALWAEYRAAREIGSPAELVRRHGIDLALVEHVRTDWNHVFLDAPDWRPVAIGSGAMIFARRDGPAANEAGTLLTDAAAARRLPAYFRQALAANYFGASLALILAGEADRARRLRAADPALFEVLRASLNPQQSRVATQVAAVLDGRLEVRPREGNPR